MYVEHHIEEHKFAAEYVQQAFHNDIDIVLLIGKLLNNIVDFSNQWRNQNVCPNCEIFIQKPGQSFMLFQSEGIALTINSILIKPPCQCLT
ncbi:hypothetical protein MTO96_019229 [Rhipicephalus appendiculatus]